ncbi:MAG: hypothetical protein ACK4Y7_05495 [Caldimicrobium sp.]
MEKKLKKTLLEIELALKKEDFDRALELYEFIENNWDDLKEDLNLEETKEALKIINFIDEMLKEKASSLRENNSYLKLRQSYTKFL